MEKSGKWRKLILVAAAGLVACGLKLWSDMSPKEPVVFTYAAESSGETVVPPDVSESESTPSTTTTTRTSMESAETIPVYICGYVLRPGVYDIHVGSFLYELIEVAGGTIEGAAVENINMVYCFTGPVAIYIPSADDIGDEQDEGFVPVSDYIRNPEDTVIWGEETSDTGDTNTSKLTVKVNINNATQEELETLPGIGSTTALAIITYREENGPFLSIDDIMKVAGIKEGRFAAIRDFISVS